MKDRREEQGGVTARTDAGTLAAAASPAGRAPAATPALAAHDVVVGYGAVAALNGFSLDVLPGEAVGLIGPNGAGKSSFLAALGGQVRVRSGSIHLNDEDVTRLSVHARARLGIARTFQATSEFSGMTTFENLVTAGHGAAGGSLLSVVTHPRRSRRADQAVGRHAWHLLERFELAGIANSYGRELSGGQRRLVEITRCLMGSPKVLLLDEPMVGVAPHLVDKLVVDLKSIRDEGIALIIVEHALEVVRELCHRVTVMAQGRAIAAGTYSEVVKDKEVQAAYLG